MMKTINFWIPVILFLPLVIQSQNIGVGTTTPAEKLDVNGNINVTGTIKTNGADGTAGQVLMKNSSGVFNWGNVGDYKNVATFTDTLNSTIPWQVPANITKVLVELWGGGGAGLQCGGGGGGYMSLVLVVTAGQFIYVTVGKAGRDNQIVSGTLTYNQSGGDTRIDFNSQYYIASGGGGASKSAFFPYPQYFMGTGGGYLCSVSATTSPRGPFYAQAGMPGGPFRYEYNNVTSNQYYRHSFYGYGGAGANTGNYTAPGGYEEFTFIVSPASNSRTGHDPTRGGLFPGGGGGGGAQLVNDNLTGANGLVLIHY